MSQEEQKSTSEAQGLLGHLLDRPIGVLMSLTLLLVIGGIAYLKMPLQLLPDGLSPPFMWVAIPTFAASPEENELVVAEPIEDALSTLAEIDRLRTFIRTNNVGFAIDLHPKSDPDLSYLRVRARLRRHLPTLPEGSQFAMIWRHDPNEDPLYVFAITFPPRHDSPAQVIKDQVIKALERVPGVSRVELKGVDELAVRIKLRPQVLKETRLDANTIISILRRDHFALTAGEIREGERTIWINASSRFESIEALRMRPITHNLTLGELADVSLAPSLTSEIQRVNGQQAASIVIYKVSTENTITVSEQINQALDQVFRNNKDLQGFEKTTFFDQGEFIQNSLDQIENSALYGGLIALCCLWFFLRSLSITLMITMAIPLCLLMTIALLYMNGQSLNVLSMMGLILSVGMVIDNAIVVLEQVSRFRRAGLSPKQAALKGTRGVGLAITLATATSLVVFLPIMMVSEQPLVGFFITKIGEPVCYALGASLLVALVHLPTVSQWVKGRLNESLSSQELASDRSYARLLNWVLTHRLLTSLFTLAFFISVGFPSSQLNRVDKGNGAFKTLTLHVIGPLNGPQKKLNELAQHLERLLLDQQEDLEIKTIVTSRGWSPERLKLDLYLTPPDQRQLTIYERDQKLKKIFPQKAGYKILLRRGMNNNSDGVNIALYGPYLQSTQELAKQLITRLKKEKIIKEVQLDLPEGGLELRLAVNPVNAALQELTPSWISASINAEFQERPIGELLTSRGEVDILITPDSEHLDISEVGRSVPPSTKLDKNQLQSQDISSVVQRSLELGSGKIRRNKRRVQVNISVLGEDGPVMSLLEDILPEFKLPIGFGIDYGERFRTRKSNEKGGLFAVVVGVILVFCLMGVLFENLLTPLAILGTIPLAFVGAIWMLWLCGTSFEVMAMIGGVILVGVVVNNGIVLIDQVQFLRRQGLERDQAVLQAASTRLRPILMTALTTIGGLIPMAFGGGESVGIDYRPLGQVVIGGLLTSTLLTLIVIPLLYTLLDDLTRAHKEADAWINKLLQLFTSSKI